MAKKQQLDLIKFVPLGVLAASFIAGYAVLQNKVASAETELKGVKDKQEQAQTAYSQVQVSQAKIESKLESQDKTLDDIKDILKGMSKK